MSAECALPGWVNVLTIGQAVGNGNEEGSALSLTGAYVEEVNLDLQERLLAEGSQEETESGKMPEGQEKVQGLQGKEIPEYEDYPLEVPCLVWGKGLAVQTQRQSLRDVVRWYLEERQGDGARLLQNRCIRVEIADWL